jgi:hypothetical protein
MLALAIGVPAALLAFLLLGLRRAFARVRRDFILSTTRNIESASPTKWVISGMMGSGKTTFSRHLSASLHVPHVEIDRYPAEEDILRQISTCTSGWIAEANPWQIPHRIAVECDAIVFLDYDNRVNYVRLLKRGWQEWRCQRFRPAGFRHAILNKALLDLGMIVYRHGRSNREKWRADGLFLNMHASTAAYFHCVSPAELNILESLLLEKTRRVSPSKEETMRRQEC